MLLACGLAWGSTQTLGKIAVSTGHQPFGLIVWQFAFGAALLGGLSLLRGPWPRLGRTEWRFAVIVALIGTLIPNTTFYLAVARLPAGFMSLIISTIPMLSFAMAVALGYDRIEARRVAGLGLGLAGVLILSSPGAVLPDAAALAWVPVALVGPLFYAMESNFVARHGAGALDGVQAMALVSGVGLVMALPLALATGQGVDLLVPWGPAEWAVLAGAVVHACAYAAFVWLAARTGAAFASQSSYVVTLTGILWAGALLGERYGAGIWPALALILGGLALVQPRAARPVAEPA